MVGSMVLLMEVSTGSLIGTASNNPPMPSTSTCAKGAFLHHQLVPNTRTSRTSSSASSSATARIASNQLHRCKQYTCTVMTTRFGKTSASGKAATCTSSRRSALQSKDTRPTCTDNESDEGVGGEDTIRVRIWRALADGEELSLSKLSNAVGERRRGELRSHLAHVERQAKTLRNKSDEWRIRRGLPPASKGVTSKRVRLKIRKGTKNEMFVRLV